MQRIVEPEALDTLPHHHPDALSNRADIDRLNRLQGNYNWVRRELAGVLRQGDHILELGASTGILLRRLAPLIEKAGHVRYTGLDLCPPPVELPPWADWLQENLLTHAFADYTIIIGIHILHQFETRELQELGQRISSGRTRLLLFSETARHRLHLVQLPFARPLLRSPISPGDAAKSVRAGFARDELADALGLPEADWKWQARHGFLGQYRFRAMRG